MVRLANAALITSSTEAGNGPQRDSPGPDLKVKKQDEVDRKIVRNKRNLAEYEAANVEQIRQADLLDVTLGPREQAAGIQHDRADESPGDKPCADIGHQLRDRQFEDLRVDQSERNDRDCDVHGRPERPKGRAPVAVKDVIPAKPRPKRPEPDRSSEIRDREGKLAISLISRRQCRTSLKIRRSLTWPKNPSYRKIQPIRGFDMVANVEGSGMKRYQTWGIPR